MTESLSGGEVYRANINSSVNFNSSASFKTSAKPKSLADVCGVLILKSTERYYVL